MIIHQRVEGGVLMGVRNVRRLELRRLEAKTLDARFLTEIQQGLNCSPFEGEAVLKVVKEVYFPFLDQVESPPAVPGKITVVAVCADEPRSEEHTSELQSRLHLVCRLLL